MYNLLGYTMLHYAVMYKRMNCIEVLIEFGAGLSACGVFCSRHYYNMVIMVSQTCVLPGTICKFVTTSMFFVVCI